MTIQLGDKAKDVISGFTGRVTGRAEYITGCTQFCLSPERLDEKGQLQSGNWFDDSRLVVVKRSKRLCLSRLGEAAKRIAGGPQDTPPERDPHNGR